LVAVLAAALLVPAATAARSPAVAGTIEGHVSFSRMAPIRVASHYPGAAGGASHRAGTVPAVAFIVGPVSGARAERGERPRLVQEDTAFHPPVIIVPVGGAVDFPNHDPFFHNVFSYSAAKRFDLGRYPRGESRTVVFDKPGIVKVYCEIHQWMRSAVLVVENPFHDEVGADGRFTLTGVPPGRYRLAVWDFDRGQRIVDVTVPAQGSARVDVSL
jgi:plastocyanin